MRLASSRDPDGASAFAGASVSPFLDVGVASGSRAGRGIGPVRRSDRRRIAERETGAGASPAGLRAVPCRPTRAGCVRPGRPGRSSRGGCSPPRAARAGGNRRRRVRRGPGSGLQSASIWSLSWAFSERRVWLRRRHSSSCWRGASRQPGDRSRRRPASSMTGS